MNNLIDPWREEMFSDERNSDWVKAAAALILLISAISALINKSDTADIDRRE